MNPKKKLSLWIVAIAVVMAPAVWFHWYSGGSFSIHAEENEMTHSRKPLPSPEEIEKLPKDGGPEFNRLVFEKSPYLIQHARNPVDWYPWGDEAFDKARKENKPVFLSIGYSTCHWCHVMEHESFEDEEVAKLMNKYFVCIKVDREERPDIDQVYMTVTQAMTGSGGWPMTVIMKPDKKPFFAGTYFPKRGRFGRPGMLDLVPNIGEWWKNDRNRIEEVTKNVVDALERLSSGAPGAMLKAEVLDDAFRQLSSRYDPTHGGFGRAPKFPSPHNLLFLLRYWKRSGKENARLMVEKTLTSMRLGGVYDHVGFGTHRYSTDAEWFLPHFEKMLYDNALVALANIEAYQVSGNEFFARTAREIFAYVLRDMTSPEGGFYSAEDADSEGEEGKFYVWKPEEVVSILGQTEADLFNKVFNMVKRGNFQDEASGRQTGDNIPNLKTSLAEVAKDMEMEEGTLRKRLEESRKKLFDVREERIHPLKDDKILTDWNGLMIAAMARAGQVLEDEKYTAAARKAADFVLSKLRTSKGLLLKRYRQGEAGLPAHLEDYAYLVWGLIELYEATFDTNYLREAIALNKIMLDHFWDEENGGLFQAADFSEKLIVRSKEIYDGARPSGNSVAALNLLRLARFTGKSEYEDKAEGIFKAFSGTVADRPSTNCFLMMALDFATGRSYEVVISGKMAAEDTGQMLSALRKQYIPNKVVLFRPEDNPTEIGHIAEYTQHQTSNDGRATAYVCRNFSCRVPTTDIKVMLDSLNEKD